MNNFKILKELIKRFQGVRAVLYFAEIIGMGVADGISVVLVSRIIGIITDTAVSKGNLRDTQLVKYIILTIIFFRRFSNVVYIICIIDMFLRIISKIEVLLGIKEISNLVNRYLPDSLLAVINSYSSGIINTILVWLYVGIYVIFLYYVVCTFFRKKK